MADRPGQSDGVRQSLTGGVDMPKKAPNEVNLKLEQSSESQELKSRNGRGGGAKTKPIGHGMGRAEVATGRRVSTRCRRKNGEWLGIVAREQGPVVSEAEARELTVREKRQNKANCLGC